jgi:membrane protein YdbS with pleckstrin-like domain
VNEKLQKLEKKFWDARTALISEYKIMLSVLIIVVAGNYYMDDKPPVWIMYVVSAYAAVCLVQLFYYLWIKKQYVRELLSEDLVNNQK